MIKSVTIAAYLFSGIIISSASADQVDELAAPTAAFVAYEAALTNGDLDSAKDLTAKFKIISAEALEQYTAKSSEDAKAGKFLIKPVHKSAKILGDFAVVTFDYGIRKDPHYDPAYLMKQNGQWKVFLKLTAWDHFEPELSVEQKKQLGELKEWFNAETKRLYGR